MGKINTIDDLSNYFISTSFLGSLIAICCTIALLTVIKKYLIKKVAYTTKKDELPKNNKSNFHPR